MGGAKQLKFDKPGWRAFPEAVEAIVASRRMKGHQGLYFRAAEAAAHCLEARHVVVVLPVAPGELRVAGCYGYPTTVFKTFEEKRGVIGEAFLSGKVQLHPDVTLLPKDQYHPYDENVRSELAVPVPGLGHDRIAAIFNAESYNLGFFEEDDGILLARLGEVMLLCAGHLLRQQELQQERNRLRKKANRLLSILDWLPDEVMLIDVKYRPIWANRCKLDEIERLRNYFTMKGRRDPEDLFESLDPEAPPLTETCHHIIEQREVPCPQCVCRTAMESGKSLVGVLYKPEGLGEDKVVELSAAALRGPENKMIGCVEVARDVSKRNLVPETAKSLLHGLTETQLLRSIVQCTNEQLHYDRVRLYAVDVMRNGSLPVLAGVCFAGEHAHMDEAWFRERQINFPGRLGKQLLEQRTAGLLRFGASHGETVRYGYCLITVPAQTKSQLDPGDRLELSNVSEIIFVPLVGASRQWLLFIDSLRPSVVFDYQDLQALTMFGKIASAALASARERELAFRMNLLREISPQTLHSLTDLSDGARFGLELNSRLRDTLDRAEMFLRNEPTVHHIRFLADCLVRLEHKLARPTPLPTRGSSEVQVVRDLLRQHLPGISALSTPVWAELPRVLAYCEPTKELVQAFAEAFSKELGELLASLGTLLVYLETHRSFTDWLEAYTRALRTSLCTDRAPGLDVEGTDAKDLLSQVLELGRMKASGIGCHIEYIAPQDRIRPTGPTPELFLAWLALINNAIDAAADERGTPHVAVELTASAHECQVCVRNNGAKVPEEFLPGLFQKRQSSKGGLGLGLVLAHEWVTSNGGRLSHKVDESTGDTCFITTLPVAPRSGSESSAKQERG